MDPAITDQQAEAERAATIRSPMEEMVKALEAILPMARSLGDDHNPAVALADAALARAKSTVGEPWRSQAVDDVLAERRTLGDVAFRIPDKGILSAAAIAAATKEQLQFYRRQLVLAAVESIAMIERHDRLSASPSQEQSGV